MSLKKLVSRLDGTPVKHEEIAKMISAKSQVEFDKLFALELTRKKLDLSNVSYNDSESEFPFLVDQDESYIVGISPRELMVDTRKSTILKYSRSLKSKCDNFKTHEGIILFLPYMMNGNKIRQSLEKEIPVAFVNLGYDSNSLERRFRKYCN